MTRDAPQIASFRALRGYIREDYAANTRSLWAPGFQAMAIYRFGVWAYGIRTKALGMPLRTLYRFLNLGVRNLYGIELPVQTRVGRRFTIAHQHGIVIHKDAAIGDDCLIRHGVTIGALRPGRGTKPPTLGDRVEVGVGAVLVGPIKIGDDVVIGPNAVVMTNVPAGCIVASPQPRIMTPPPAQARGRYRRTAQAHGRSGARKGGRRTACGGTGGGSGRRRRAGRTCARPRQGLRPAPEGTRNFHGRHAARRRDAGSPGARAFPGPPLRRGSSRL